MSRSLCGVLGSLPGHGGRCEYQHAGRTYLCLLQPRTAMEMEKWAGLPVFFPANALLFVSSCRILAELAMMLWFVVGALFPALLLAAPPPINKLALFPDKSAWCEAKNITQIVGHSGCESKSIQNRYGSTLSVDLDAADFHLQMAPEWLWGLSLAQEARHSVLPLPGRLLSVSVEGQISFCFCWEEQGAPLSSHPSVVFAGPVWDSVSATVSPTPSLSPQSPWFTVTPACQPSPCGKL